MYIYYISIDYISIDTPVSNTFSSLKTLSWLGTLYLVANKRGLVQGINKIAMGAGTGFGGFLGVWLDQSLGWRYAFLVQIPLILLGIALVAIFARIPVNEANTASWRKIYFEGSKTLTSGLILL